MSVKKLLFAVLMLYFAFYFGGCEVVGLIANPTQNERTVPAEYKLKNNSEQGVLVFVDQAPGSRAEANLRSELSEMIDTFLVRKAGVKNKNIISYKEILNLKAKRSDFSGLSITQIGKELGVSLVLYVLIEEYRLFEITERDYHNGFLATRSVLFDVPTGKILWPRGGDGRVVRAIVEFETKGRKVALDRLTTTTAHCISRYLYDCPFGRFKTSGEQRELNYKEWE